MADYFWKSTVTPLGLVWHLQNAEGDTIAKVRGRRETYAEYEYRFSTGHKQDSWAFLKSHLAGKRWVERQLAAFWEPPSILNPASRR